MCELWSSGLNDIDKIVHLGSFYSLGLSHSDQSDTGKDLSLVRGCLIILNGFCLFCFEQQGLRGTWKKLERDVFININ